MDPEALAERGEASDDTPSRMPPSAAAASSDSQNSQLWATLKFIGFGVLFNGLLWSFGFFVDTRGWISDSASYIALATMAVFGCLIILAIAAQMKIPQRRLAVCLASVVWLAALWGLDRSARPPELSRRTASVPEQLKQVAGPTRTQEVADSGDTTVLRGSPAIKHDRETAAGRPTAPQPEPSRPRDDGTEPQTKTTDLDSLSTSVPSRDKSEPVGTELTLRKLFESDFSIPGIFAAGFNPKRIKSSSGNSVLVGRKIIYDKNSLSKYVAFFVPFYREAFSVCAFIAVHLQELTPEIEVGSQYPGEAYIPPEDFTFHGRIIIYHENLFTIQQLAELEKFYEGRNFKVQFRGPAYVQTQKYLRTK